MDKFVKLTGVAAPLPVVNIDTDMIIPKDYLKTIKRTGLGKGLFAEARYNEDGSLNESFVLNKPAYQNASILVAGDNFGCGSSREHAPWALTDLGLRAVVSSEIADIFRSNALKNGLLPVVLDDAIVDELLDAPGIELSIDVATRSLTLPDGRSFRFPLDAFAQTCLLDGVDQLGYLLQRQPAIQRFEAARDAAEAA